MLASSTRVLSARLASRTCSTSGSAARSACRHARTSRSICAAVAQQATATSRTSVAGVATRVSAHQGVGKPSAGHGSTDVVQVRERCGDAQLFAGRAEIEAGAPVEPVGTGTEALPAVVAIELAQVAQELVVATWMRADSSAIWLPRRSRSGGSAGPEASFPWHRAAPRGGAHRASPERRSLRVARLRSAPGILPPSPGGEA